MSISTWRGTQNTADRLEELASALDAGLSAESALRSARVLADPSAGITAALRDARLTLSPAELELLSSCEQAGALPRALRAIAASLEARRRRGRQLLGAIAYPVLVFGFAELLCFTVVPGGGRLGTAVLVVTALIAACGVLVRRRLLRAHGDPGIDPRRWPVMGPLLRDASEIPYLEALAALHGAGVKLGDAHRIALRTVALAAPRAGLVVAERSIESGRSLTESLAGTRAIGSETLELLGHAEPIGALESALARAAARRREMFEIRAARLVRAVGVITYAAGAVLVLLVALTFYGGLQQVISR